MSSQSLERGMIDLQKKVLPARMHLFNTHSIGPEEQTTMVAKLYPAYKRQQEDSTSGMKVSRRLEELQDITAVTTSRSLAGTRLAAKYIELHLVADTYRQAIKAHGQNRIPEFCFFADIGWAQYQIASNIGLANRAGDAAQKLKQFEHAVEMGQKDSPIEATQNRGEMNAAVTFRLALAFGKSIFLLDDDPTGKKLIDHYVQAMQERKTAESELRMHPAQGLNYVKLGGEQFRESFGRLYPLALALRPRPELRFS
jgi:hypothetical protein